MFAFRGVVCNVKRISTFRIPILTWRNCTYIVYNVIKRIYYSKLQRCTEHIEIEVSQLRLPYVHK